MKLTVIKGPNYEKCIEAVQKFIAHRVCENIKQQETAK